MDWIENSSREVADLVHLAVRTDDGDTEKRGFHLRQGRDVVGVLAFVQRSVLGVSGLDCCIDAIATDSFLRKCDLRQTDVQCGRRSGGDQRAHDTAAG